MIPIPKDFQEFIKLLNDHNVEYLLVGGYAVAFHGFVRFTGDIDFFISKSDENTKRIVEAFKSFGFVDEMLTPNLFKEDGNIIRVGNEPLKLEIMNAIDGVSFEECFSNKQVEQFDNLKINFISLKDLIKNKQSTLRGKDKIDAEELLKIEKASSKKNS